MANSVVDQPSAGFPVEREDSVMGSDQLLRGMHKVLAHDLPNQLVVLQSLLQLLDQEESARLSDDGREYLRRLQNATRHAGELARFLKEMDRLHALAPKSEAIALPALARELQGELQRRHADRQFEFHWQWHEAAIVGDARVYVRALTELCALLLPAPGMPCRVAAESIERGDTLELAFTLEGPQAATVPRGTSQPLEQRLELILARAWLAQCGASVEVASPPGGPARFCITMPKR